jgi:hypothetical protein
MLENSPAHCTRTLRAWTASLLTFATASVVAPFVQAMPTEILVRVIAQDAKFMGDHTGGAAIILREADSGKILAEGKTTGATGDTDRIMNATGRSPKRARDGDGSFSGVIDIDRPTLVTLEAAGPLGHPQSALKVSAQRWVLPGHHMRNGDGWTIELPGLILRITTPTSQSKFGNMLMIPVDVQMTLMCGCAITKDGPWKAEDYIVQALLFDHGRQVAMGALSFAGTDNRFIGGIEAPYDGSFELIVEGENKLTGNGGIARLPLVVPRPRMPVDGQR